MLINMDTIGKLVLDDDGIKIAHKNYIAALKKSTERKKSDNINYVPSIRSLVMRNQSMCEYCNNHEKMKPAKTCAIQLCINVGVQICDKCLQEHKQHISFLHNSVSHDQLAWWQFKSLNSNNPFISSISYDKVFKNLTVLDEKEYKMCLCAPIFISRKKKTLTFPMYIKNRKDDYFDVTHIQEVSLDTFCNFHPSLDKNLIVERIETYLKVE